MDEPEHHHHRNQPVDARAGYGEIEHCGERDGRGGGGEALMKNSAPESISATLPPPVSLAQVFAQIEALNTPSMCLLLATNQREKGKQKNGKKKLGKKNQNKSIKK